MFYNEGRAKSHRRWAASRMEWGCVQSYCSNRFLGCNDPGRATGKHGLSACPINDTDPGASATGLGSEDRPYF
ncbi:hypothetical protein LINGRAHAP2_LOCUS10107 [Linum grandiflorum]